MKKRSWAHRIFKAIMITAITPVVIIILALLLLYTPAVQQRLVDFAIEKAGIATGYNIAIGRFGLTFPLEVEIEELSVSRNDTLFASGERIGADISLLPLFTGKVELNHLSLEQTEIDTRDLMPDLHIDGKVGYARLAVRDANLLKSTAKITQLHIEESEINITLPDTTVEKEESEPLMWAIALRNATIKNSRLGFALPGDTMQATAHIGKLHLGGGNIDLASESYAINKVTLQDAKLTYDRGTSPATEVPLDHITLDNIEFAANSLLYAREEINADITSLTFEQPGGITIRDARSHISYNSDTIRLHSLHLDSKNGSYIDGHCTIPRAVLGGAGKERFTATIAAGLNRNDLARLVTPQLYNALGYFNDEILSTTLSASGNTHRLKIDSATLHFPGLGSIEAVGDASNILTPEKATAQIELKSRIRDISRIIGIAPNDSAKTGRARIDGNITYNCGKVDAALRMRGNIGTARIKGHYDIDSTAYSAHITARKVALGSILPHIPLHNLTMQATANGRGYDLFDKSTNYNIGLKIDTLHYDSYRIGAVQATAKQADGLSTIEIEGKEKSLLIDLAATTNFNDGIIDNHTTIDLEGADLKALGITNEKLDLTTNIEIAATTDLAETHLLTIAGERTGITLAKQQFKPGNLHLNFATSPAATTFGIRNGDLNATGGMDCGYNALFAYFEDISAKFRHALKDNQSIYNLQNLVESLPTINLDLHCGSNNVIHNFLAFSGIKTDGIEMQMGISPQRGLNIEGSINNFGNGSLMLDTIKVYTRQIGNKLRYLLGINNASMASLEMDNSYNALLHGSITNDTLTANLSLRDNIRNLNSRFGLATKLAPYGLSIHFLPEALLYGTPYNFSSDNHIEINKGMAIDADVTFYNSDSCGFRFTTPQSEGALQNFALQLSNITLEKIVEYFPVLPQIGGTLNAELGYTLNGEEQSGSCNALINSLAYEGKTIGNEQMELALTTQESDNYNINLALNHNGSKVLQAITNCKDIANPTFKGNLTLDKLPLGLVNIFLDRKTLAMDGSLNSYIDFDGQLHQLKSNGYISLDSTYASIPMLGSVYHPTEDKIIIDNSLVRFNRYRIYNKRNNPFTINGTINIANLMSPNLNLRLAASDYEVLNAKRSNDSPFYGNMSIDLNTAIRGTLDKMKLNGSITLLSNSDFGYILPASAFESKKELDGLVEFVNFNDTTSVARPGQTYINLGDIDANFTVNARSGAKLTIDLDPSHENYVTVEGEGNLNATYDSDNGVSMTGVYKLNGGQMKLTLPIIPLKTFYIQEGGSLTWTGDMFNPTLNVTALEKTTVSVEFDDNSIQPVTFNVGVAVTNTVSNLGIDFTMSSPENSTIQNELNELDKETMNRYAVAMIITGTYLGGSKGVTAVNALSSFLDAKINQISGSAIKDFDVNFGINDALNAETGTAYTNYSFSFSKRFFNDRITVVIGGEVKSGDNPEATTGNNSFINNVSLEWKLSNEGNRFLRVFYDKNYQSILEGEIIETGVGYVYKRKLNTLRELFDFRKKKKKNTRAPGEGIRPASRDSEGETQRQRNRR